MLCPSSTSGFNSRSVSTRLSNNRFSAASDISSITSSRLRPPRRSPIAYTRSAGRAASGNPPSGAATSMSSWQRRTRPKGISPYRRFRCCSRYWLSHGLMRSMPVVSRASRAKVLNPSNTSPCASQLKAPSPRSVSTSIPVVAAAATCPFIHANGLNSAIRSSRPPPSVSSVVWTRPTSSTQSPQSAPAKAGRPSREPLDSMSCCRSVKSSGGDFIGSVGIDDYCDVRKAGRNRSELCRPRIEPLRHYASTARCHTSQPELTSVPPVRAADLLTRRSPPPCSATLELRLPLRAEQSYAAPR